nr:hypothetical protein CoNPh37_CDS0153 [Staphylococcus phage S-CoN_Ph37]
MSNNIALSWFKPLYFFDNFFFMIFTIYFPFLFL